MVDPQRELILWLPSDGFLGMAAHKAHQTTYVQSVLSSRAEKPENLATCTLLLQYLFRSLVTTTDLTRRFRVLRTALDDVWMANIEEEFNGAFIANLDIRKVNPILELEYHDSPDAETAVGVYDTRNRKPIKQRERRQYFPPDFQRSDRFPLGAVVSKETIQHFFNSTPDPSLLFRESLLPVRADLTKKQVDLIFVSLGDCLWNSVLSDRVIRGAPPTIQSVEDVVKSFAVQSISNRMMHPIFLPSTGDIKGAKPSKKDTELTFGNLFNMLFPSSSKAFLKYKGKDTVWKSLLEGKRGYLKKWFRFLDNHPPEERVTARNDLKKMFLTLQAFPKFTTPTIRKPGQLVIRDNLGHPYFFTNSLLYRVGEVMKAHNNNIPRAQRDPADIKARLNAPSNPSVEIQLPVPRQPRRSTANRNARVPPQRSASLPPVTNEVEEEPGQDTEEPMQPNGQDQNRPLPQTSSRPKSTNKKKKNVHWDEMDRHPVPVGASGAKRNTERRRSGQENFDENHQEGGLEVEMQLGGEYHL